MKLVQISIYHNTANVKQRKMLSALVIKYPFRYNVAMYNIKYTDDFESWIVSDND